MSKQKYFFIFLFFLNFKSAYAFTQKGHIEAEYGVGLLTTDIDGNKQVSSKMNAYPRLSLQVEGGTSERSALLLGLNLFRKQYVRFVDDQILIERAKLLRLSMGYRYWLFEPVSFSLAFASDYSYGDPQVNYTNMSSPDLYPTSAHDTVEYGLEGTLLFVIEHDVYEVKESTLAIQPHYYYSFTPKDSHEKANEYGIDLLFRIPWK